MPGVRISQVLGSTSIGPSLRSVAAYLTVARVVPAGTSAQIRTGTSKGRTVEKVPPPGVKVTSLKPLSPAGVAHRERFVIDRHPPFPALVRETRRTVTQGCDVGAAPQKCRKKLPRSGRLSDLRIHGVELFHRVCPAP